jgi:hypothetical protein
MHLSPAKGGLSPARRAASGVSFRARQRGTSMKGMRQVLLLLAVAFVVYMLVVLYALLSSTTASAPGSNEVAATLGLLRFHGARASRKAGPHLTRLVATTDLSATDSVPGKLLKASKARDGAQQLPLAPGQDHDMLVGQAGVGGPLLQHEGRSPAGLQQLQWQAGELDVPIWWMAPFFERSGFSKEAALLVQSLLR